MCVPVRMSNSVWLVRRVLKGAEQASHAQGPGQGLGLRGACSTVSCRVQGRQAGLLDTEPSAGLEMEAAVFERAGSQGMEACRYQQRSLHDLAEVGVMRPQAVI